MSLRKEILRLLDDATRIIYSEELSFNELVNRISPSGNNIDLLKSYIAIQFSTKRAIPFDHTDLENAISEYLRAEKLLINHNQAEIILGLNQSKAEKGFLEISMYFTYGKLAFESNEYSIEGLRYRTEKAKKGPLTLEEHEKFQDLTNQISKAESKLNESKKNDND